MSKAGTTAAELDNATKQRLVDEISRRPRLFLNPSCGWS
jgi:hypothetical protein